jgi:chemotaxis protein histidine kinase CheA
MSNDLQSYLQREAREYLDAIEEALTGASPDPRVLERSVRAIRGVARVARALPIAEVAGQLEGAAAALREGALDWSDDVRARLQETVRDLRRLLDSPEEDGAQSEMARAAETRWAAVLGGRKADEGRSGGESLTSFLRAELGGLLAAVDRALAEMKRAPGRTEPLEAAVRRAGPLQGMTGRPELGAALEVAAGLGSFASRVVRGELRDDLAPTDFLLAARDALDAARRAIERGGDPGAETPELQRFRAARTRFALDAEGEVVPLADLFAQDGPRLVAAADTPVPGDAETGEAERFVADRASSHLEHSLRAADEAGEGPASETLVSLTRSALAAVRDLLALYGRDGEAAEVASASRQVRPGIAAADLRGILSRIEPLTRAAEPAGAEPEEPQDVEREVVPIESLLLRGDRALEHALSLRDEVLAAAAAGGPERLRPLLEEVFDLLDLGREADAPAG